VLALRQGRAAGTTLAELARTHNGSLNTVAMIVTGKTYRWVDAEPVTCGPEEAPPCG
jgi:hypothetical protein